MKEITGLQKSIIPSCDFSSLATLKKLVKATKGIEQVSAYKVGFELAIVHGLKKTVRTIRQLSGKPIIYDHQKGGTDIPEMGERFAGACKEAGLEAVIIFPFTGPQSEEAWIRAIQAQGLGLIVGAEMTHQKFLASEGGFIENSAPKKIFELAAKNKVKNFVVPGTKPEKTAEYKKFLEGLGTKPVFFLPGIGTQGGQAEEIKKALGKNYHLIVGRSLYQSKNMKKTCLEFCAQLG